MAVVGASLRVLGVLRGLVFEGEGLGVGTEQAAGQERGNTRLATMTRRRTRRQRITLLNGDVNARAKRAHQILVYIYIYI